MNVNRLLLALCGLVIILTGCNNKRKFNRGMWNDGDGITYRYRDAMLDDLLQNHKLKGLTYRQVYDTLGRPDGGRADSMYYDVDVKWDGYPPSYLKRLVLYFGKDSVINRTRVIEQTHKKKQ